jgi:large subunit ribosomal protein L25
MSEITVINAEMREDVGKGASRRLRREAKVPAVIYGGHREPANLMLGQNELLHLTENESFYASVLEVRVGDLAQQVVVRDMHRHPFKPIIMHIDFMRVSEKEVLKISVPIHFVGEEKSPAGKASGVVVQHQVTDIEIEALPKDLPEFLTVDLSDLEPGDSVMLSAVQLPEGVTLTTDDVEEIQIANAVHVKESQGTGAAAAEEAEAALAEGELGVAEFEEEDEEGESAEDEEAEED